MSNESRDEQIARVQAMAEGQDTWDLSDNDLAALRTVLAERAAAERETERLKVLLAESKRGELWAIIRDCAECRNPYPTFGSGSVCFFRPYKVARRVLCHSALACDKVVSCPTSKSLSGTLP